MCTIHRYEDVSAIPGALLRYLQRRVTLGSAGLMSSEAQRIVARDRHTRMNCPAVVAREGTRPIGWMLLDRVGKVEMYVVPEYRGKRVATRLLVALSDFLGVTPRTLGVYNAQAERVKSRAHVLFLTGG